MYIWLNASAYKADKLETCMHYLAVHMCNFMQKMIFHTVGRGKRFALCVLCKGNTVLFGW